MWLSQGFPGKEGLGRNGLRKNSEARSHGSGGHGESLVFYSEPGGCLWRALSRGGPRSDFLLDRISPCGPAPRPVLD